jgi:hypothetical protein
VAVNDAGGSANVCGGRKGDSRTDQIRRLDTNAGGSAGARSNRTRDKDALRSGGLVADDHSDRSDVRCDSGRSVALGYPRGASQRDGIDALGGPDKPADADGALPPRLHR